MILRALICRATALTLLAAPALAQPATPPAAMPAFNLDKIPRPAESPQEHPLYPGVAPGSEDAKQVEAWSMFTPGNPVVRNVTRPTYSVFRPGPGKANGAAVILAPGGGFMWLSMQTEGWQAAQWLADRGVTAFVLKYRPNETPADSEALKAKMAEVMGGATRSGRDGEGVPGAPAAALADGQAMVKLLRAQAKVFGIDPKRIGFVGFSAGAMTGLSVTLDNDAAGRPDFVGLIYPPMSAVSPPAGASDIRRPSQRRSPVRRQGLRPGRELAGRQGAGGTALLRRRQPWLRHAQDRDHQRALDRGVLLVDGGAGPAEAVGLRPQRPRS